MFYLEVQLIKNTPTALQFLSINWLSVEMSHVVCEEITHVVCGIPLPYSKHFGGTKNYYPMRCDRSISVNHLQLQHFAQSTLAKPWSIRLD